MPKKWASLLDSIEINERMGKLAPAPIERLDACEVELGIKLPPSYRDYCSVFGAGQFGNEYRVAVPGYTGKFRMFSLGEFNEGAHSKIEYEAYSKDPEQHRRGIFFAFDMLERAHFFFDPNERKPRTHEYAVYKLESDYELSRVAVNYWELVTRVFLEGEGGRMFLPVK